LSGLVVRAVNPPLDDAVGSTKLSRTKPPTRASRVVLGPWACEATMLSMCCIQRTWYSRDQSSGVLASENPRCVAFQLLRGGQETEEHFHEANPCQSAPTHRTTV
jgi:hypothetical protein